MRDGPARDMEGQTCFELHRAARHEEPAPATRATNKLPPQLFAIMAVTTLTTFGTLTGGYTLFF